MAYGGTQSVVGEWVRTWAWAMQGSMSQVPVLTLEIQIPKGPQLPRDTTVTRSHSKDQYGVNRAWAMQEVSPPPRTWGLGRFLQCSTKQRGQGERGTPVGVLHLSQLTGKREICCFDTRQCSLGLEDMDTLQTGTNCSSQKVGSGSKRYYSQNTWFDCTTERGCTHCCMVYILQILCMVPRTARCAIGQTMLFCGGVGVHWASDSFPTNLGTVQVWGLLKEATRYTADHMNICRGT